MLGRYLELTGCPGDRQEVVEVFEKGRRVPGCSGPSIAVESEIADTFEAPTL